MTVHPCWNCRQPANHTLAREGSDTLQACDNCTRIDRAEAERLGWTITQIKPEDLMDQKLMDEIDDCTCVEFCDEDPKTACRLSGRPHVHPEDRKYPGAYGPCPVHPGRPGDH